MSQQHDLPESMAWRVIGRLESGQTQRSSRTLLESPEVLLQGCGIDSKKQRGGISIGGRTDLHIIRNGTLTGRRYADEILRPHVIPYAGAIGDSFVFQDDNARPHIVSLVVNMLEAETIQRMEWPACSPDLNPIEYVWDMLGRRIAAQPRPPATVRDLEIALLEEWNSIPQSLIDNLIASMANRCAAVSAVRGDHTPY
ncbi:transposable element Tcb1 transposase [Trichonephila clavipes]|nr:transposable element Tcb1 transposase [Trichonephila clavipes]